MVDVAEDVLGEVSEVLLKPMVVENILVLLGENEEVKLTHVSFNRDIFTIHITQNSISIKYPFLISPIPPASNSLSSEDSFSLSFPISDSISSDNIRNSIPQSIQKSLINFTN